MSRKKKAPAQAELSTPPASPLPAAERKMGARIPVAISVLALVVSAGSMYQSCESRRLAYLVGQPALKATIELVEAPVAAKEIGVRVLLENGGQTTAKGLYTELGWAVVMTRVPLEVGYSTPVGTMLPTSDLAPQADTTLTSDEAVTLAHDHDVKAIHTDQRRLYVYGRSRYRDVYNVEHEFRFCGVYRPIEYSREPLKLAYCDSYNETVQLP
jgi:hypothetical protein